jgi:tRNA U34 5-carboxymethylaminomethyl modifying enzyme MnmG/GidA
MFSEANLESLQNDIKNSTNNDELLKDSSLFLMSKLEDYNSSDNSLSDAERDNIETQLDYHKELKELHQGFQEKKDKMRDDIKQKLSFDFQKLQNIIVSETHINEIDDILNQDYFNIKKKNVDDNVNIIN